MINTRRTAIASAAAAAVFFAPAAAEAAKPDHVPGSQGGKSQLRQLLKDIDGMDARLERIASSKSMTKLADVHESVLVANTVADRAELAAFAAAAQADPAYDTRGARKELRELRGQNYQIAISIVRGVERATEDATAVPEAAAELVLALEAALAARDETDKDVLKAAREHLSTALDMLDDEADADEDEDEDEAEVPETPEVEDPVS